MPGVFIVTFVWSILYIIFEVFAIRFLLKDLKKYDENGRFLWILSFIVFPLVSFLIYMFYRAVLIKNNINSKREG